MLSTVHIRLLGALGLSSQVEKHLEMGKKLLQEGKLSESLLHYDKAVGEDSLLQSKLDHPSLPLLCLPKHFSVCVHLLILPPPLLSLDAL